jgi:hypothetical protein
MEDNINNIDLSNIEIPEDFNAHEEFGESAKGNSSAPDSTDSIEALQVINETADVADNTDSGKEEPRPASSSEDSKAILEELRLVRERLRSIEIENGRLKNKVEIVDDMTNMGQEVAREIAQEYENLKKHGISIYHMDDRLYKYKIANRKVRKTPPTKAEVEAVLADAKSTRDAARKLGVCYATYKKYAKLYDVHQTIAWPPAKYQRPKGCLTNPYKGKYPLEEVLQGKWPEYPIHRLKDKLIRSGLKHPCCEMCGFTERRVLDGKIPLLLCFEDENIKNLKLENLKILCYNCSFISGHGYIQKGKKWFDPEVLQGSKKILPARH